MSLIKDLFILTLLRRFLYRHAYSKEQAKNAAENYNAFVLKDAESRRRRGKPGRGG